MLVRDLPEDITLLATPEMMVAGHPGGEDAVEADQEGVEEPECL
jgi:hypothetical protein